VELISARTLKAHARLGSLSIDFYIGQPEQSLIIFSGREKKKTEAQYELGKSKLDTHPMVHFDWICTHD
jgi:hypothetical protein